MAELYETISSDAIMSIPFGVLLGVLITILATKYLNRLGRFRYTVTTTPLAVSQDDAVFGDITVAWRNNTVDNLFSVVFAVKNSTSSDYDNIKFKVWAGDGTKILTERSYIVDTTYIVEWTPEFQESIKLPIDGSATEEQIKKYTSMREYLLPVFNRSQELHFCYWCTCTDAEEGPFIEIESLARGIRLKRYSRALTWSDQILGEPVWPCLLRGLYFVGFVLWIAYYQIESTLGILLLSLFLGLSSSLWGVILYRLQKWFKRIFVD